MVEMIKDRIAVEPLFTPEKIGSLYVPEQAQSRVNQGIVKYIGPDVTEVKIGQWVLFSGYTGTLTKVDGELLIIMEVRYVVAILDLPTRVINGLYFRSSDGDYYECEHEMAITLIARSVLPLEVPTDNKPTLELHE